MDFPQLLAHRIKARYPFIWLETYEFERVYQILKRIALDHDSLLFRWTPVEGLSELGLTMDTALPAGDQVTDAQQVVREIVRRSDEPESEIFVLEGMGDFIHLPEMKALIRKLTYELRRSRSPMTVICLSPIAEIPVDLLRLVDVLALPESDLNDYRAVLNKVLFAADERIDDTLAEQLVHLANGMTLFEAELAFSLVQVETGFQEGAVEVMMREKELVMEKAALLDQLGDQ